MSIFATTLLLIGILLLSGIFLALYAILKLQTAIHDLLDCLTRTNGEMFGVHSEIERRVNRLETLLFHISNATNAEQISNEKLDQEFKETDELLERIQKEAER